MQHLDYAVDHHGREVEQNIIIELLRNDACWSRQQLQDHLKVSPTAMGDALQRLQLREVIELDGDYIQAQDSTEARGRLDALAGVVVHVLVSAHPKVLTLAEVAQECERDLDRPDERHEIELALRWIAGDELAVPREGWIATRPAVRAAELSF